MVISVAIDTTGVNLVVDSITTGSRTAYFEGFNYLQYEQPSRRYAVQLVANVGSGALPLAPAQAKHCVSTIM